MKARQVIEPVAGASGTALFFALVVHPLEENQPGKTGEYDHTVEFDLPEIQWIGRLCALLARRRSPDTPWLEFTYEEFIRRFRVAVDRAGLKELKFTPYGLRHGGASHDAAARRRALQDIQKRGNWRSFASVRRYEKSGRLALELRKIPDALRLRLLQLPPIVAARFEKFFGKR